MEKCLLLEAFADGRAPKWQSCRHCILGRLWAQGFGGEVGVTLLWGFLTSSLEWRGVEDEGPWVPSFQSASASSDSQGSLELSCC